MQNLIQKLVRIANLLDSENKFVEADTIGNVLVKLAQRLKLDPATQSIYPRYIDPIVPVNYDAVKRARQFVFSKDSNPANYSPEVIQNLRDDELLKHDFNSLLKPEQLDAATWETMVGNMNAGQSATRELLQNAEYNRDQAENSQKQQLASAAVQSTVNAAPAGNPGENFQTYLTRVGIGGGQLSEQQLAQLQHAWNPQQYAAPVTAPVGQTAQTTPNNQAPDWNTWYNKTYEYLRNKGNGMLAQGTTPNIVADTLLAEINTTISPYAPPQAQQYKNNFTNWLNSMKKIST
jgi:hypothetical protein